MEDTFVTRICAMKQVDSTNNEAKRQAQLGAPAGSLFVAEDRPAARAVWVGSGVPLRGRACGAACFCGPKRFRNRSLA